MSWNKMDDDPFFGDLMKPSRKAPPPPNKPRNYGAVDNPSFNNASKPVPSAKPNSAAKRKIEITVLQARPMSEVGFRSDSSQLAPNIPPPKPESKPAKIDSIFYPNPAQSELKKPTIIRAKKPSVPPPKKSSITAVPPSSSLIEFSPEIFNVSSKAPSITSNQKSRPPIRPRPSSMIDFHGPNNGIEIFDNLKNEHKVVHAQNMSRGPYAAAKLTQAPQPQPRVVKRTVTTTTTTTTGKKDNSLGLGGVPIILPFPMCFGVLAAAGTMACAAASASQQESEKTTTTTVTRQLTNGKPTPLPRPNPSQSGNDKKIFPVKPLAPTVSSDRVAAAASSFSRRSSAASTISGYSFDGDEKKSKPKPARPGKPPPKRPPKPKMKPKANIPPSSSTSALDELIGLDSKGFHMSDRDISNPSPLSLQFDTCQVQWDVHEDKKSLDQVDQGGFNFTSNSSPNQQSQVPSSDLSLKGRPHGKALFDYESPHEGDLPFKEGDFILLLQWVDDDWLRGELNGREGIFPQNFVEIIEPLPKSNHENAEIANPSQTIKTDEISGPRCRALFDFEAQTAEDLSFKEGDIIRLLSRVQTEWGQGELRGNQGLFPLTFVEIIEDLPVNKWSIVGSGWPIDESVYPHWPKVENINVKQTMNDDNEVKAQYEFDGIEGELSFLPGDKITVISQVDPDWLFGELKGKRGRFPATFVDHVPKDLPPYKEKSTAVDSSPISQPEASSTGSSSSMLHATDSSLENSPTSNKQIPTDQQVNSTQSTPPMNSDTADYNDNAFMDTDLEPHCIALYDYTGQNDQELSFKEGDRLTLTSSLSEDWFVGYLNDDYGMFPRTYVNIIVDLSEELPEPSEPPPVLRMNHGSVPSVSDIPRARAIYDYDALTDEELTIREGDEIVLLDKLDDHWFEGELNDVIGRFPVLYVEVITPL